MKNLSIFKLTTLVLAAFFTLTLSSCEKEDNDPQTEASITDEEAVDIIESALVAETEGIGAEVEDAAYLAEEYAENLTSDELEERNNPCEETYDSTVVHSINNPNLTADYTTGWTWTLDCNAAGLPTSLNYARTAEGAFETTRLVSTTNSTSSWVVSNLLTGANYVFNGAYNRTGTMESRVGNQNTYSTTTTIEVDNLNVDKGERRIESGIADITLVATGPEGNTSTIEADVVFNGGGSVTIIINGNSYSIDLY